MDPPGKYLGYTENYIISIVLREAKTRENDRYIKGYEIKKMA
jgi:hypothetical protein